jgi:putative selenate reductase molybdopterin-binding subunit
MHIQLTINGQSRTFEVAPGDLLLELLRREAYFGVKHGCETGDCGVCAVLLDGRIVNSCIMLAAQADGHAITTIEGIGSMDALHPLQQAFIDAGAIQCGYCTPAQILAAKALLDANPSPTETEVREAIAGVLCRCTGYEKPVAAILATVALPQTTRKEA